MLSFHKPSRSAQKKDRRIQLTGGVTYFHGVE